MNRRAPAGKSVEIFGHNRTLPITATQTNIEVRGTHSGLVFSKQVYPHLAEALCA